MTERRASVLAQAKVNLVLRVLARERSGYHQIETLFCRLDLGDVITVRVGDAIRGQSLDCAGPAVPESGLGPPASNLAFRAASRFAAAAGWPAGFAIEIEKRIPVGGGLGGGSADAGAVLRALNALAPTPLAEPALLTLATALGADVPFLTLESALALAWGRGERLLVLPPLPGRDAVLAVPPFAIATSDAYGWLAAARDGDTPLAWALEPADMQSWSRVAAISGNDFEEVVFSRHPELARVHAALSARQGVLLARLSGSGSTLVAVLDGADVRGGQIRMLGADAEGWRVLITRTAERVAAVEVHA